MRLTRLHAAAKAGDVGLVRELTEALYGVRDAEGRTALMHAAIHGHEACVQQLLGHESRLRDGEGRTALMYAVIEGHQRCVRLLAGHETRLLDVAGRSALMYALLHRRTGYVSLLLQESRLQTTRGFDEYRPGTTALMIAARLGQLQAVQALRGLEGLDEGKRAWKDVEGRTALTHALEGAKLLHRGSDEYERIVSMLEGLEGPNKGEEEAPSSKGPELKLDLKQELKQKAEREVESAGNAGMTEMMHAAYRGDEEAVARLLKREKRKRSRYGWTALMFATAAGHAPLVELLRPYEARMRDVNGWTALMLAAELGDVECVRLLLPTEAELCASDGTTPLELALLGGWEDVAALLRRDERGGKGEKECGKKKGRLTPLMRAVIDGDGRVDGALLEYAGQQDRSGHTALMHAVFHGRVGLVRFLSRYELGMKDYDGRTALMHAVERLELHLIKPLLGEREERDKKGRSALDIAYEIGGHYGPPGCGHHPRRQDLEKVIWYLEGEKEKS